jgi:hypothetical protein
MSSHFYYIIFFAAVNAARNRRHDGDCAAPTTAAAVVQASSPVPVPSIQSSNPMPSVQSSNPVLSAQPSNPTTHVEYVYITEYTTVYPTSTPPATPSPNMIGTSNLTTLVSKTKACSARSSNSTGMPLSIGHHSSASLSGTLIPYGSGLPASSSLPYVPGVSITSLHPTPDFAASSLVGATSLPQYPPSPVASSVGQSPATPSPSPSPTASSACKRKTPAATSAQTPLSIPHFMYDPLPESSTAPAIPPTSPTMPPSSTAIVIIPITPTPDILLANTHHQPKGQWEWSPWKRADEFGIHNTDETSTMTSTTTTEVTVTTRLPSVRSTKTKEAKSTSANASKSKQMPTSTPTADVVTSISPPDLDCYYPYPGGVCGPAKTTLVTKTKAPKPETTQTSWCAYPGQEC